MDYQKLFSDKMDELLAEEMQLTNTAGTVVGIVEDSRLHFIRSYGAKDFEASKPTDPATLFCIASVTKSFICSGIMKLQEEGKLSVHDPINEYLPITIGFDDDPITIHHLMTHQSGIPNIGDSMWSRNREGLLNISHIIPKYPFASWEDGFRYLNSAAEYISKPGERFHYNNFGYGILSKLISEITGNSFKEYLRTKIFDPLEMHQTGFFNGISNDQNLAKAYMDKPGSTVKEFMHVPYEDIRLTRSLDEAAGGLFSSVEELSNYMIMHLQKGQFGGNQVLSAESIEEMHKPQFKEKYPNAAFGGFYGQSDSGYGYGFAIDSDFHGTTLVQHSGSFVGSSAWFAFLPEYNRGVIILSNHHPSPRIFAQGILVETLGKQIEQDWPLMRLRLHHSKLTGEYHSYKGMNKIRVGSDGAQLIISTVNGENSFALIPLGDDPVTNNYYIPTVMGGKDPVQFFSDNGEMWLHQERNRWKKIHC